MGTVFDITHSFKLSKVNAVNIFVAKDLHLAIKIFAKKKQISIREATSILILEGWNTSWTRIKVNNQPSSCLKYYLLST